MTNQIDNRTANRAVVAITGITGNMGQATLAALAENTVADEIRLLVRDRKRALKFVKRYKSLQNKVKLIVGSMTDRPAVTALVSGASLVVNMAAVIPPRSDQNPTAAIACNQTGTDILVSEIEKISEGQPALVHISTVALYGDRTGGHPFARVGDPLLVSPLDVYSATKLRGEFRVLESSIRKWAVLRQSAMLHPQMLSDNVHDGLMFHTVYESPLEWVTAHDSGVLLRNIVNMFFEADAMPENFWRRCHNIAGGKQNRRYGLQSFDEGFVIIGGTTKDFFKPAYNATRNFHGVWYLDGDELNDMFGFRSQTVESYWKDVFAAHPVFKLGKCVPKSVIGYFLFRRLLKDKNAPSYWAKHGDDALLTAYFGGKAKYDELKTKSWADVEVKDGSDIPDRSDNATPVYYGFDITKSDAELTQADMQSVAEAHGGKLLGNYDGDMYKPLEWQNSDGIVFSARPYTVLRAGHWINPIYSDFIWDFDRLAKTDKVIASIWYDTHETDENYVYSLDNKFKAHAEKFGA